MATPSRGVAFVGTVWVGGDTQPVPGVVVLDGSGRISQLGSDRSALPADLLVLGGPTHWILPGIVDAHVHLFSNDAGADARPELAPYLHTGVVGLRDLGSPLRLATRWRTGHRAPPAGSPFVAVSGPIFTTPGGYPSRAWGSADFAEAVTSPAHARWAVQRLAAEGIDVVKIALASGEGDLNGGVGGPRGPAPTPALVRAIVDAAHAAGLPTVASAHTTAMVQRAVAAGVDELAHTPTERLPPALIDLIAAAGVSVTSTLQTSFSAGSGRCAAANAADLVEAGVRLRYGTDFGTSGPRAGVDPRELDRLADAGLGRLGALRAATEWAAQAGGIRNRTGRIAVGTPAALVLLPGSPLVEPGLWRTPSAVYADQRLTVTPNAQPSAGRFPAARGGAEHTSADPESR